MQIDLLSDREITFTYPTGVEITEYESEHIRVKSGRRNRVNVSGSGLFLKKMTSESVVIVGKIYSLEFEETE